MEVRISLMSDNDYTGVLEYVQNKYKIEFKTTPKEIPRCAVYAANDKNIIGAMCMEFSTGEPFNIEKYFDFGKEAFPLDRTKTVCLSKWTAERGIGRYIVAGSMRVANLFGKSHTFACSKPSLIDYIRSAYKLPLTVYPFELKPETVEPEHHHFFLEGEKPLLYAGNVNEWYDTLVKKRVPSFIHITL